VSSALLCLLWDHHVVGPCVCDRCWPGELRRTLLAGVVALVTAPPSPPEPRVVVRWRTRTVRVEVPAPRPRPRRTKRPTEAPIVVHHKDEPPRLVAPPVDDDEPVTVSSDRSRAEVIVPPAPDRVCRVCGDSEPIAWAQADLCSSPECLTSAAAAGRRRSAIAERKPTALAARLGKIRRVASRRERLAEPGPERIDWDAEPDPVDRIELRDLPEVDSV
jgi:hypothetical protein